MTTGLHITPTIKLIRKLDEGGMGTVWAAENLALDSLVAVKMLTRDYADEPKSIARFKQEAQRAARVRSPHVATIFDHGMTVDGEPYIVMELLEGETLRERIKRIGALPLEEVETLLRQIAKALTAAHKLGVVHRDIKPANLFIVDNGGEPFVKVVDFGIAKQMDVPPDLTTTNSWLGSPPYMSPEQYMNPKQVDLRTDLWSLGVVVYEAITGARPFHGETAIAIAMAITKARFKLPSEIRPDLPKALDGWMRQALAVEPEKRFGSAGEMAEAFGKSRTSSFITNEKRFESHSAADLAPTVRALFEAKIEIWEEPTDKDTTLEARIVQSHHANLQFFEGAWISTPESGYHYCRFVRGQLHVAYSYSGNANLSGEYYQCQIVGHSLFARFRWPASPTINGYVALHASSDDTLIGGWWVHLDIPTEIASDLSKLNGAIPGMNALAWRRLSPSFQFPDWAEAHFASIAAM